MEILIKEKLKIIFFVEKESINLKMDLFMKEILLIMYFMVEENLKIHLIK